MFHRTAPKFAISTSLRISYNTKDVWWSWKCNQITDWFDTVLWIKHLNFNQFHHSLDRNMKTTTLETQRHKTGTYFLVKRRSSDWQNKQAPLDFNPGHIFFAIKQISCISKHFFVFFFKGYQWISQLKLSNMRFQLALYSFNDLKWSWKAQKCARANLFDSEGTILCE